MNFRFSIMTLNLWNTEKLDERKDSIIKFFTVNKPDFLCIQEIRKETRDLLDDLLDDYNRVEDSFIGWEIESNIYYKKDMFKEIEHGRIDLNMPEVNRGLFYLRVKALDNNHPIFISTAHLTHQGNADEVATSRNYRQDEANLIKEHLLNLVNKNEGAIICGDFNDPFHPTKIISENTDFVEVFRTLNLEAPLTFPCSSISEEYYLVESLDKIMHNSNLKPIMATSPRLVLSKGISDHYPVYAMFELGEN